MPPVLDHPHLIDYTPLCYIHPDDIPADLLDNDGNTLHYQLQQFLIDNSTVAMHHLGAIQVIEPIDHRDMLKSYQPPTLIGSGKLSSHTSLTDMPISRGTTNLASSMSNFFRDNIPQDGISFVHGSHIINECSSYLEESLSPALEDHRRDPDNIQFYAEWIRRLTEANSIHNNEELKYEELQVGAARVQQFALANAYIRHSRNWKEGVLENKRQ